MTELQDASRPPVKKRAGMTAQLLSRKFVILIVIDALLWIGAFAWEIPSVTGPLKVAFGVWPGAETLTLAREKGLLPEDQVKLVEMTWSSAAARAFSNRVVDAAVLSLDEVILLRENGNEARVVMVMDQSRGADALMARPETPSVSELRGKRVGVEVRSVGMLLLAHALDRAGLTLEDVDIVPLNLVETEEAFNSGEVDAVVSAEPVLTRLRSAGAVNLFDSTSLADQVCRLLVVRSDALQDRGQELKRLVDAHFSMLGMLRQGTGEKESAVLSRREGISVEEFRKTLALLDQPDRMENVVLLGGESPALNSTAGTLIDFMLSHQLLARRPGLAGWIEPDFLKSQP